MPTISQEQLIKLQYNQKNIRNICILAHVDHGKTTLSDSLLASNGIISSKLAGKIRYLDSREDEQERGITMQASAISLYFKILRVMKDTEDVPSTADEYLINLIDSPGHVDFSSEVSTASRLCDGALVLVDAIEGVQTQTITVLRQAWVERVRPILVINKIDRLVTEIKLTPLEAYIHIKKILEQVNAVMGTFFSGDRMEEESRKIDMEKLRGSEVNPPEDSDGTTLETKLYDWNLEDKDDSNIYFDPALGNVVFCSAIDGWGFRVQQFAAIYAQRLGMKESVLKKCLWGDYYLDPKAKRVIEHKHLNGRLLKPMFVQFVLDNIWAVYENVIINPNREKVEKIVNALNIKLLPRDLKSKDTKTLLSAIFWQWLPLPTAVLLAVVDQLPSPIVAQKIRLPKMLYPNGNLPTDPNSPLETALFECDSSHDAPVIAYISKMFAIQQDMLSENKRKQLTAEELRERKRMLEADSRTLQKKSEDISAGSNVVLSSNDDATPQVKESADVNPESSPNKEVLIGFARIYSGTIRVGQTLYVLGPKYDPKRPHLHCSEIKVDSLYMMMGRELMSLQEVPAGNVFGIGGLEGHILKNGTISSTKDSKNLAGVSMTSAPIVRVALEPVDPSEISKLVEGLRLLNQADPCVEVLVQETGEHVILTAGELHLERCLKDLRERFAKIEIQASPPIVPFRESIVYADLTATKEKEGATLPRGLIKANLPNHFGLLCIRVVPLPRNVTTFLNTHRATIKSIVDERASKVDIETEEEGLERSNDQIAFEKVISLEEFKKMLEFEFGKAETPANVISWHNIIDKIWSFGPKRIGSNILINNIPNYKFKPFFPSTQLNHEDLMSASFGDGEHDGNLGRSGPIDKWTLRDFEYSIRTGFQLATQSGPLCAEPMDGVCVILDDFIFSTNEIVGSGSETGEGRSKLGVIQGYVISTMRESCRQGFLDWSPRLNLAMYTCDIQASEEVLGKVYGLISKKRGRIVSEELKEGTSFWQIRALMPVVESFGFAYEIRKRTSGAASPQLLFSGFEMLDLDPFWVPTTEEELEDLGEKADKENLAKKYMESVRSRKGLFVERKIVAHAEKQRTLKK